MRRIELFGTDECLIWEINRSSEVIRYKGRLRRFYRGSIVKIRQLHRWKGKNLVKRLLKHKK